MATKKKTSKKSSKSKKIVARKSSPRPPAQKRSAPKKSTKRTAVPVKSASKKAATGKKTGKKASAKTIQPKAASGSSGKTRNQRQRSSPRFISRESSGLQSGDLQGLSNRESVDSESVDELLEEGNAFEAGIVSGVEDSGNREGQEVRTRQVPEDDVPGEYLDED